MAFLLSVSAAIDAANARIGRAVSWLILATVLISAGNAVVRKAFQVSSNSLLEVQWYLFSAVFLLCAGYTLMKNAHVRIDFVSSRLSARGRAWVDVVGIVVFLVPLCGLLFLLSLPLVIDAWRTSETSPNAGGLIRWPVYALLPLGMVLLLIQGASELIKRIAFLRGFIADPLHSDDTHEPGAAVPASST